MSICCRCLPFDRGPAWINPPPEKPCHEKVASFVKDYFILVAVFSTLIGTGLIASYFAIRNQDQTALDVLYIGLFSLVAIRFLFVAYNCYYDYCRTVPENRTLEMQHP